ncbi:MAG TPA: SulP family inorganic anion transporter [Terriglobales bacterium]|nr:SulP family inorganic anion transporter [Terriglobales bacterium]
MSARSVPPQKRGRAKPNGSAVQRKDVTAALINAVVSVPDGLAAAALAGVNPVYGLYTSVAAPICGSLLVSAQLMQIATTSASALVAGQVIAKYSPEQRDPALFLLVILTGLCLAVFSLLRLGRLVRWVSHAVMTGFLAGVAVVLILDQLGPLVGVASEGRNEIEQLLNLVARFGELNDRTLVTGTLALALMVVLNRTRMASFSSIAALVVPSLLVALLGWESVQRVVDVSPIPRGLPTPSIPDFSLVTPDLLFSAFALAVVIAVQGAGVSQSVENPDETRVSVSRDMFAQGAANVASGLLSGIPAGGSVGQTALNVSVGAQSRWAGVLAGVWMLVIVLLIPDLVGQVPMTVLAALMIQAGISAIDFKEATSIWNTGGAARWAILVTFLATLLFSIPLAVGAGVLLTTVLYVASAATDVRVRALAPTEDGRFREEEAPKRLSSNAVVVLDVYGSLFFAGARRLEETLPSPDEAIRPVVVLRLRGRTRVGATLIEVLDEYADELAEAGGRLYLSGVDQQLIQQLQKSGKLDLNQAVQVVPVQPELGAATQKALNSALEWLWRAKKTGRTDETEKHQS